MSLAGDALDRLVESQIFFPEKGLEAHPSDFGMTFEDVSFRTEDGITLHGWYVPAQPCAAVLLFCHGNAGNISHRLENVSLLKDQGVSVFIFDYRGYGRSGGRITEKGFYLDSEAAHRAALERAEAESAKLVLFGRSLGGVAAVHIAAGLPCSGVILESTFTNLADMAAVHFPIPVPRAMLRKRFDSLSRISRVTVPVLFFHGDADDIVPYELGQRLFEAANQPKDFVTIPAAGHNDTYVVGGPSYFRKIRAFIDGLPPMGQV